MVAPLSPPIYPFADTTILREKDYDFIDIVSTNSCSWMTRTQIC